VADDRELDTRAAYEKWRSKVDMDEIGVDDTLLEGLRDPSPGREIKL